MDGNAPEPYAVVVGNGGLVSETDDSVQVQVFGMFSEGFSRFFGYFREAFVVLRDEGFQERVRLFGGCDIFQLHLCHEPVLECAEQSFDPPSGLWRVGRYGLDAQIF